jgi:hypothetical protein
MRPQEPPRGDVRKLSIGDIDLLWAEAHMASVGSSPRHTAQQAKMSPPGEGRVVRQRAMRRPAGHGNRFEATSGTGECPVLHFGCA